MRSLRSTRKLETSVKPTKNKPQDENSSAKMCQKIIKPGKVTAKSKQRPALADKTNSGSDLNQSSSPNCAKVGGSLKTRPKRNHQLPSRLLDHELSPVVIRNGGKPKFSSTPLSVKPEKSIIAQPKRNKNTIAKNLTAALTVKSVASKETIVVDAETKCAVSETKKTSTRSRTTKLTQEKVISPVTSPLSKYSFINRTKITESSPTKANLEREEILIEDKLSSNEKCTAGIAPIYQAKLSFGYSKRQSVDRLALYEFEVDPGEAPTKPKKKQIRKKCQPRKKKPDDDAAMKMLLEQLKKIQESALLKKLAAKKKIKQNTLNVPQFNFPLPRNIQSPIASHQQSVTKEMQHQIFQNQQPSTSYQNQQCIPGNSERLQSPVDSVYDNDLPNDDYDDIPETNFSTDNALKSSFFTDMPVASSSMISHVDHKPASPWRVNYNTEQKKWPYNFHVKASMTPSYQRDTFHYLGLDDKNIIPEENVCTNVNGAVLKENAPGANESEINTRNLKQTSILSFYEESMKKTMKKPQPKTSTENYSYEEYLANFPLSPSKKNPNAELSPSYSEMKSTTSIPDPVPEIIQSDSIKDKPAIENCFGFDDSDEIDQENISPVKAPVLKNINVVRGGGTRMKTKKGILKERNQIPTGPTRVNPRRVLNTITVQNNNLVEEEKVNTEVIVEKENFSVNDNSSSSNQGEETVPESSGNFEIENTENDVALFEDPAEPEFVHFNKPSRRSYEIRKRPHVKFNVQQTSDNENLSDGDSDGSLNPTITSHKAKKASKKTVKRKNVKTKVNKEADKWAAGFNSMLEEIDEFALSIE